MNRQHARHNPHASAWMVVAALMACLASLTTYYFRPMTFSSLATATQVRLCWPPGLPHATRCAQPVERYSQVAVDEAMTEVMVLIEQLGDANTELERATIVQKIHAAMQIVTGG